MDPNLPTPPRRNRRYVVVAVLVLAALALAGGGYLLLVPQPIPDDLRPGRFGPKPMEAHLNRAIIAYWRASPEADVERALAEGDRRFVGVMGYALVVPGVEDRDLKKEHGVKVIPYVSDMIEGYRHKVFVDIAHKYAEQYNAELLSRDRR
jgi:hypothetical protein